MNVRVIPGRELTGELWPAWCAAQAANPALVSPYFCPHYTALLARVRPDTWIGVLEHGPRAVGFLPFQRRGRRGGPPGGPLSDYQALIAAPGQEWDAVELVRGCGLGIWDFDHLLAAQQPFAPHWRVRDESPCLDLSAGYDAYVGERHCQGSRLVPETERKARKLAREVGPLRFVAHAAEPAVLQTLWRWKSDQYRRTGLVDLFAYAWTRELVEAIAAAQAPEFAGVLSALYAGDRLAAAHFGMRSARVLHYWFPAYDPQLENYSPGMILLLRLAAWAADQGLTALDLGKGPARYKTQLRSYGVGLAEGSVELPGWARLRRRTFRTFASWADTKQRAHPARLTVRAVRRVLRYQRFR